MGAHGAATRLLSAALVVVGVAMIVSTVSRGGGPLSVGLIVGILFCLAGAGRLYLSRDG